MVLREEFSGHGNGHARWQVTMPAGTLLDIKSASGDVDASGGSSAITIRTASGDTTLRDFSAGCQVHAASGDVDLLRVKGKSEVRTASGDIEGEALDGEQIKLESASGDVKLRRCGGKMSVSTASGDIRVEDVTLAGSGKFSSASGDVTVTLAGSPTGDLTASTASGDLTLDYQGQPMVGTFVLTAKKDAETSAPFAADSEEEILRFGQTYVQKTFVRQGAAPKINLSTASGSIELRK